jgi:hypothetical protein
MRHRPAEPFHRPKRPPELATTTAFSFPILHSNNANCAGRSFWPAHEGPTQSHPPSRIHLRAPRPALGPVRERRRPSPAQTGLLSETAATRQKRLGAMTTSTTKQGLDTERHPQGENRLFTVNASASSCRRYRLCGREQSFGFLAPPKRSREAGSHPPAAPGAAHIGYLCGPPRAIMTASPPPHAPQLR